jgi:ABC-type nitrate/sulfonate/bicarbonate transport system ATPase subunit
MDHLSAVNNRSGEPPSDGALVRLENVSLNYQSFEVLRSINLSLSAKDFVCVIGSSGCGKTSLLRVIAGYDHPTEGEITVAGRPHRKPNSEVGVVFQQPNLYPWLTVAQNIEFSAKMKGLPRNERQKLVQYYLDMVGLSPAATKLPYQLSGGMKQRVAIVRALAANPKVILMDEPFSALDALTRESMQLSLYRIWLKTEKCVFFITHDVEEALLLSTRILVMHSAPGRIVQDLVNPFAYRLGERSLTELRSSQKFVEMREYLVSGIKEAHAYVS